jgi:hypothetical protein
MGRSDVGQQETEHHHLISDLMRKITKYRDNGQILIDEYGDDMDGKSYFIY